MADSFARRTDGAAFAAASVCSRITSAQSDYPVQRCIDSALELVNHYSALKYCVVQAPGLDHI
jgi:hypothetical protein